MIDCESQRHDFGECEHCERVARAKAIVDGANEEPDTADAIDLAELVIDQEAATVKLRTELERLRTVIRTGGAMYRAERAAMGVPGGLEEGR